MEPTSSKTEVVAAPPKGVASDKLPNTFEEVPRRSINDARPAQFGTTLATGERTPQQLAQHDADKTIPQQIAAKFLRKGDKYYFADMTLAFVDEGKTLRAETENRSVVKDLVAIARVRGWQAGLVSGSESFRREVWKEAFAEGLQVEGYKPSAAEVQAAERERERRATRGRSDDEGQIRHEARSRDDSQSRMERAIAQSTPASRVRYGKLVDHGQAPYQFEPNNPPSYYLQLDHGRGAVRTYWGVGLADALRNSRTSAAIGDEIGVARIGSSPVSVTTRSVDDRGEEVVHKVAVHRNDWVIEKSAYFEDQKRVTQDIHTRRDALRQPGLQEAKVVTQSEEHGRKSRISDESETFRPRTVGDDPEHIASSQVLPQARSDIERLPRDQFVDAFVSAGLIRPENREYASRVYEAVQAYRGRHRLTSGLRPEEIRRAVDRAVLKAAEDLGRAPINRERDSEHVVASRSDTRDNGYVRM